MSKRILGFFSSLKLTVVLLGAGVILVFVGTLGQVDKGLYDAQNLYFRSFVLWWQIPGMGIRVPVFPAGYTIGSLLLANLVCAHFTRFKWSSKKSGIWLTHVGVILLLLGQLLTDLLQVESGMRLTEGETKNYSVSSRATELAFVDTSDKDYDNMVVVPDPLLSKGGEIKHDKLPFTIVVKKWYQNSSLRMRGPMVDKEEPPATQGMGPRLHITENAATTKMDERDLPSVIIELRTATNSLGTWLASLSLDEPQTVEVGGKTWQLALRPTRYYKPFYIHLEQFRHDLYKGTEKAKNFSSRIRVIRPETGEDREVLIRMNSPLRYNGETYYQASFDPRDSRVTVLQVVRNPSWLTPYLACILVGLGLLVQFMIHLFGFVKSRRGGSRPAAA